MIFKNENRNPNELHDYLIANDCIPIGLSHNAQYNEDGEKVTESTEIYIGVEPEKEEILIGLVNQFMSQ